MLEFTFIEMDVPSSGLYLQMANWKGKNDDQPRDLEVFPSMFGPKSQSQNPPNPHSGHLSMEAFRLAPSLRGVLRVQLLRAAEEGLQGVVGAAPRDSAWGTISGGCGFNNLEKYENGKDYPIFDGK